MKFEIKIDSKSIDGFEKKLKVTQEELEELYLQNICDYLLTTAQYNLESNPETMAFDQGNLSRSGVVNVDQESQTGVVGFAAPYADDVEFGRDPGSMPPVNVLIAWAKRKGIPKPEKVAWAIAHKIKNEGIAPKPFLRVAIERTLLDANRIWRETIITIMQRN